MRFASSYVWPLLLLNVAPARAQGEAPPVSPSPTPQVTPQATPSESDSTTDAASSNSKAAPASAATTTPSRANEEVCGLSVYDGFELSDATTAAALVCDALRDQNAPMAQTWGDTAQPIYRVQVRRLGTHVMLGVTEEQPPGVKVRSRTIELASLEETVQGAPRIVEALIKDVPVSKTARANNQTTPETNARPTRGGYAQFEPGIVALWAPKAKGVGYGIDLGFSWQAERAAAGLDLRFAGGKVGELAILVNGHYDLTDNDVAPIVGVGLGITTMWVKSDETLTYNEDGNTHTKLDATYSGSGPFVELVAGVEALRTTKTRLNAVITVDLPTFSVDYEDHHSRYSPVVGFGAHALF